MQGGEIYVKKIPSMKVVDIASVIDPVAIQDVVGIRPGEKIHEQMIGSEDSASTYDFGEYFVILPQSEMTNQKSPLSSMGKRVPTGFTYSSDNNSEWMSKEELQEWVRENSDPEGRIPLK
jgi:FlaA1/EpsC-like NDP-sugar epimerase